jgi:hypothetical protein
MIGKTLGKYKIIEKLGVGGMGTVYKAKQLSLSRMVAVKALPQRLTSDTAFVQRFLNEARAIAALNHPNIVQIFDVGKEGETYYYTMELVEGVSLEDIVQKREPVPVKRAISIISSVAKALAYTHRRSIVHRDIKPSNIMIDRSGRIKLADFGLALREDSARLTIEGGIIGTPEFMSPEQASGKTATALSDIYSLGVVFYEMVTGRSPFEAETSLAVIARIRTEAPEPPRSINPDLPPEIEEIILKMMAKEPEQRYQNCREIMIDLKLFRAGESMTPPTAIRSLPASPFRKRAIAALLIIATLGVGILALRSFARRESPLEKPPTAEQLASQADAAEARGLMKEAMTKAAEPLLTAFIEAVPLPEIREIEVTDEGVVLAGLIEVPRQVDSLRRLSAIKLKLEGFCDRVIATDPEPVDGGAEFQIELRCVPDVIRLLGSDAMLERYPLTGRVWQLAGEMRKAGAKRLRENKGEAARESFQRAAELYAKAPEMVNLEQGISGLDKRLAGMRAEVEAFTFPDTIVHKNGDRIECKIEEETKHYVRIQTRKTNIQLARNRIASIDKSTPEDMKRIAGIVSEMDVLTKQRNELKAKEDELHLASIRISLDAAEM